MHEMLKQAIRNSAPFRELCAELEASPQGPVLVTGVAGSLDAVISAALSSETGRQLLILAPDLDQAQRWRDDLVRALGLDGVPLFSGSYRSHPGTHDTNDVEALRALLAAPPSAIVSHTAGLFHLLPNPSELHQHLLTIQRGDEPGFTSLVERLELEGFERKDFVEASGDFSVRGGILDVYPFVGQDPVRIEFLGDKVDSIREFDPRSQRSIRELDVAAIVPNLLVKQGGAHSPNCTLLDFLQSDALIIMCDPQRIECLAAEIPGSASTLAIEEQCSLFTRIHILPLHLSDKKTIDFASVQQPAFNGNTRHLREYLEKLSTKAYSIMLMCDTQSELHRLKELVFSPAGEDGIDGPMHDTAALQFELHSLNAGFILPASHLAVLTEHQIFNRLKRRAQKRKPRFLGFSGKEVQQLRRGDFVVHADYGIGVFDGLQSLTIKGVSNEVLRVRYEGDDILYVNLNFIERVQKYSSKEGHVPKLTKLGRPDWDRLKARAKKRIKDIARELIQLYARRKKSMGYAHAPDTQWQKELEASFMYEDTFDQSKSTREVKEDMESPHPMDRLVCGDVGFGKTEVAVRAAFKAVMSGKQVAVLVPTTILALQHYNTFVDRMARFSTNIRMLSRFKTKKEQKDILASLSEGGVDIVIGTHRLLSKDVRFKDLGLLVIDEEHRFGVAAKEKLRQLKTNVDTLTLTATPIPRTLHFSLMGVRDLSIIATPPRNRLPVITEITTYSADLVREAIEREVARGGQVYFVHDRINDIAEATEKVQQLVPGVRVRFAHGQMHAHELEDVMLEFLERRFDVLVCTKIIESGLDIPSVNTIIINRADRFGMAELYQLRGRVGRSNTQAYAYLLTPPPGSLPRTTLLRLQALEEFTELGAGFHLAMRDLEIRGAGNLLGGEQSGFIESMGFETYSRILDDAVAELKEEEFEDLFGKEDRVRRLSAATVVETDCEALLPRDYVANDTERLELYRRMYALNSREQLRELGEELRDRFGQHPPAVANLLKGVETRLLASRIGFRKVRAMKESVECDFPAPDDTQFYESEQFQSLMGVISSMRGKGVSLRSSESGLTLVAVRQSGFPEQLDLACELLGELATSGTSVVSVAAAPQPSVA